MSGREAECIHFFFHTIWIYLVNKNNLHTKWQKKRLNLNEWAWTRTASAPADITSHWLIILVSYMCVCTRSILNDASKVIDRLQHNNSTNKIKANLRFYEGIFSIVVFFFPFACYCVVFGFFCEFAFNRAFWNATYYAYMHMCIVSIWILWTFHSLFFHLWVSLR